MSKPGHHYSRRVLATAGIYIAAAWAATEALLTVVERFGLAAWWGTLVTALFVAGLPVTVFLVWKTAGPERKAGPASILGSALFLLLATAGLFWATRPAPVPATSVAAVLPCEFEGDSNYAYRAEGLPEDVHARLSRVNAVKISSWNSSLFVRDKGYPPQKIAEVLHVDRLVECRMKSGPDRIELTARVIDPAAGSELWEKRYDFAASDLGTVVTELAGTLLNVLGTPAEASESARLNDLGTFSPEAYDLYLQARYRWSRMYWEKNAYEATESLLARSLAIDPDYAEALVLKAQVCLARATSKEFKSMDEPHAWLLEARKLSARALALDPGVFEARRNLAEVCGLLGGYYSEPCPEGEAERLLEEECKIRGDTAEAWACWHGVLAGQGKDNTQALERWLALEPTSIDARLENTARIWQEEKRPDKALDELDTLRALDPNDQRPLGLMSNLLRREGQFDEVLAWRHAINGDTLSDNPWFLARLATDYINLGLYEQARDIGLKTWETRRGSAMHFLPKLWVYLGEKQKAIEAKQWLAQTLQGASGSSEPRLWLAEFYATTLHDNERAQAEYAGALGDRSLQQVCRKDDCVRHHAIVLAHLANARGEPQQAESWVKTAQQASGQAPDIPARIFLLIEQGRRQEALGLLRERVLYWRVPDDGTEDSRFEFPLLDLVQDALFDPLRDMPEFQQLLKDYDAHLEPQRRRVLEAERTGDWEALRRRTYQRIKG